MLTPIANIHRYPIPRPGAIVIVKIRPLEIGCRWRKWIVESYPLSDSPDQRFSRGIHTVWLRALDNNERVKVSGHYCEEYPSDSL